MATHSSTLAWKIQCMEEPGWEEPMGWQSRTRLSDFTVPTVPAESSPFSTDTAVGDAGGNRASCACREQLSI